MRDVIIRSVKTFVQAFVAAWLLTGNSLEKNALLGAGAAGIAAVWNAVINVKGQSQIETPPTKEH